MRTTNQTSLRDAGLRFRQVTSLDYFVIALWAAAATAFWVMTLLGVIVALVSFLSEFA